MADIDRDLEARLRAHMAADGRVTRPGLAARVISRPGRRGVDFRRLAIGGAAVLMPVALVAAFVLASKPPVKAPSSVQPAMASPTPVSRVVNTQLPGAGTSLLYYHNPGHCRDLVAVAWTGAIVGHVALDPRPGLNGVTMDDSGSCDGYGVTQNPDGSRLVYQLLSDPGSIVLDPRTGDKQTGSAQPPLLADFADDSKHSCALETTGDQGQPAPVVVRDLDHWSGPARLAATVPVGYAQAGPIFLGCSVSADRAILAQTKPMETTGYYVIALSTGKILADRTLAHPTSGAIVLSPRDDFIALSSSSGDANQVYRTADGKLMADLTGRSVVGFSADGSRVVVTRATGRGATQFELEVLQWQAPGGPKVVWTKTIPHGLGSIDVESRRGTNDLAIAIKDSWCNQASPPPGGCSDPGPLAQLLIVDGGGTEHDIVARAQAAW